MSPFCRIKAHLAHTKRYTYLTTDIHKNDNIAKTIHEEACIRISVLITKNYELCGNKNVINTMFCAKSVI